MSPVISDRNVIRAYTAFWVAFYLIVYFFLKSYLGDTFFRDSQTIQKLALSSDASEWGGAYVMAAFIVRIVPGPLLTALVACLGSFTIWYVLQSMKTIMGLILFIPIMIPFIILNMMDFGKESFVIPLTFLILFTAMQSRTVFIAFVTICFIYLGYGLFFRPYYLIILAAFMGCILLVRVSLPLRLLLIALAVVLLFVLPSKLFMDLQGDRDNINYIANKIASVVHTAILNPLPPNGAFNFLVNYFYAIYRLVFPVFTRQSPNDFVQLYDMGFIGYLLYIGLKYRNRGPVSLLPLLYIAHLLVLFIFEPDSGSFLRHSTSIFLYLLPTLQFVEQMRVDKFREEERKKAEAKAPGFVPGGP